MSRHGAVNPHHIPPAAYAIGLVLTVGLIVVLCTLGPAVVGLLLLCGVLSWFVVEWC